MTGVLRGGIQNGLDLLPALGSHQVRPCKAVDSGYDAAPMHASLRKLVINSPADASAPRVVLAQQVRTRTHVRVKRKDIVRRIASRINENVSSDRAVYLNISLRLRRPVKSVSPVDKSRLERHR